LKPTVVLAGTKQVHICPPCSGGKGHAYYVTVKTLEGDKVVAETILEMGKY
jgi:hypothetical protein